jgi:hypothetical protein
MERLSFGWAQPVILGEELRRPLKSISARFDHPAWRGASAVTLWRTDGSGLRIQSRMHDVAPRMEVGVLEFEVVSMADHGEQFVDLGSRFRSGLNAAKLSVIESGVVAESGVVISGENEIAIVAGAFPLTLAIRGIAFESLASDPEYPWDDYERSEL